MVKIYNDKYINDEYNEYFNNFGFPLSDFQKYAIEGIINKKNVLITAHTGSGKTLPAEFLIEYYAKNNKKIIYTTPIKALSNQKYNDFKIKFPNISIGIITGDQKQNPDASVIIMTTEILHDIIQNKINNSHNINTTKNDAVNNNTIDNSINKNDYSIFDINLNDIEYVVFDEVHFLNDVDRGEFYEKIFMSIPHNIGLLMLSATLDKPEIFVKWIESKHGTETYLIPTDFRVVPLTHYMYITLPSSVIKSISNKTIQEKFKSIIDKPLFIKNTNQSFDNKNFETQFLKINEIKNYICDKKIFVSPKFVLNNLCNYLYDNNKIYVIDMQGIDQNFLLASDC